MKKQRKIKKTLKKQTFKKTLKKQQKIKKTFKKYNNLKGGNIEVLMSSILNISTDLLHINMNMFGYDYADCYICRDKNTYNSIISYIDHYLTQERLIYEKEYSNKIWFFPGTQFLLKSTIIQKRKRSIINYKTIAIEFMDNLKFENLSFLFVKSMPPPVPVALHGNLQPPPPPIRQSERHRKSMRKPHSSVAGYSDESSFYSNSDNFNIFGELMFSCILKYTHSYIIPEHVLHKTFDREQNKFVCEGNKNSFIEFLNYVEYLFKDCSMLYKCMPANILKEFFKYANPKMNIEKSEIDLDDGIAGDTMHRPLDNYNMLETEINALTLESSVSNNKMFNIRMILNAYIQLINKMYNNEIICAKSGGEVFRYYKGIGGVNYTNDIDTKIFYSRDLSKEKINEIRVNMLRILICITIFLKSNNNIKNINIKKRSVVLDDLECILEFKSFCDLFENYEYDSRIRSKLISGHRLFSLDIFIGCTFTIDQNNFNTFFSASPLDLCNYESIEASYTNDDNDALLKPVDILTKEDAIVYIDKIQIHNIPAKNPLDASLRPTVETVDREPEYMYIMNKYYLLADVLYLLQQKDRILKKDKDLSRLNFLLGISADANRVIDLINRLGIDTKDVKRVVAFLTANGINITTELIKKENLDILNIGSENYLHLLTASQSIYNDNKAFIDGQIVEFGKTLGYESTEESAAETKLIISNKSYKTPLSYNEYEIQFDIMDYNP